VFGLPNEADGKKKLIIENKDFEVRDRLEMDLTGGDLSLIAADIDKLQHAIPDGLSLPRADLVRGERMV
jgi:hypothetical protein